MVFRLRDAVKTAPGIIEGSSRVLRELLRTPKIRRTVDVVLTHLDPESTPLLVQAVAQDPVLFLDLVGSVPALANVCVEAACAVVEQLTAVPPGMLAELLPRMISRLRTERLGWAAGQAVVLLCRAARGAPQELEAALAGLADGFGRGVEQALTAAEQAGAKSGNEEIAKPAAEHKTATLRAARFLAERWEAWAGAVGRRAAREGSSTAAVVQILGRALRQAGQRQPEFFIHVARPLVQAWNDALHGRCTAGDGDDHE